MKALKVEDRNFTKKELPLAGFSSRTTYAIRTVVLLVMVTVSIIITNFVVINVITHYNVILGRPWIHRMKAIPSTFPQAIKYPTKDGKRDMRVD